MKIQFRQGNKADLLVADLIPGEPVPASSTSSASKVPIRVFDISDPNNRTMGISIIEGKKYQQVKKMYNDYAVQKGIDQDAGSVEPFTSKAIQKWFEDYPAK